MASAGCDPVDDTGRQRVGDHQADPTRASDGQVAHRRLAGMGDGAGDEMGIIGRRRIAGAGRVHQVARMVSERRIDRGRLDEGERDGLPLRLGLAPECLGEAFDRELRRAIRPLIRNGDVAQHAADIDDRAAGVLEVLGRNQRAMHHAPVRDVEQAPLVFERHGIEPAVDEGAGVVDPRIISAIGRDRLGRGSVEFRLVGDVGDRVVGQASCGHDLVTHGS